MQATGVAMAPLTEEEAEEAFLEKFRRDPQAPRPEWALRPDAPGGLDAAISTVPLFMSASPTAEQVASSPYLQALQSLLFDGSPDEVAINFKQQGLEALSEGKLNDAFEYFCKGTGQTEASPAILSQLFVLKSQVLHKQQSFSDALTNAKRAIGLDCTNQEALKVAFPLAKAMNDGEYLKSILSLFGEEARLEVAEYLKEREEKQRSMAEQRRRVARGKEYLATLGLVHEEGCERTLLSSFPSIDPSSMPTVFVQKHGKHVCSFWPVLLVYPSHAQCDFIQEFADCQSLAAQLKMVFETPAEWDTRREFSASKLALFVPNDQTLFLVDQNVTLRQLFPTVISKYDHGILAMFIFPAGHKSAIDEFTARYAQVVSFP